MKGTARPSWTKGRHEWLYALKMRGVAKPKGTSQGSTAQYCRALGWTAIDAVKGGHVLTNAGRDQLERWDAGDTTVAPKPKPPTTARLLQLEPAELATRLLDLGADHARAVYEALHTALFGFMPPAGPHYHHGGLVGKLPDEHVPRIIEAGQDIPAHLKPCPIKFDIPPPVMREGAPTECDGNVPPDCALVKEIEAQAVRAPQFGIRQGFAAHLGQRVTPKGFSECLQCRGKGVVAHNFACPACHGAGTIRRTVEL